MRCFETGKPEVKTKLKTQKTNSILLLSQTAAEGQVSNPFFPDTTQVTSEWERDKAEIIYAQPFKWAFQLIPHWFWITATLLRTRVPYLNSKMLLIYDNATQLAISARLDISKPFIAWWSAISIMKFHEIRLSWQKIYIYNGKAIDIVNEMMKLLEQ